MATKLNAKTSVVDYLKSNGKDSSFSNRAQLASQVGIKNYTGTAQQNANLLKALQSQKPTSPSKPPITYTNPVVTAPTKPPANPAFTYTNPVVHPVKPTFPIANTKPAVVNPSTGTSATPVVKSQPAPTPTPAITPNPLEDKVKSLETELGNLKNTLSSKVESEQDFMQPQPMFDLGQLASLLQPQQPKFDMSEVTGQFNDMFTKLQSDYNSRLEAMQRMLEQQNTELQKRYDELLNKFKYNQAQLTPVNYNIGGDGISLFGNEGTPNGTPTNTSGTPVGYRQSVQMNDALLRYMQNLWGGGF